MYSKVTTSSSSSSSSTDDSGLTEHVQYAYDQCSIFDTLGSIQSIDEDFYYEADKSPGYKETGAGYTATYLYDESDGTGTGKYVETSTESATGSTNSSALTLTHSDGRKLSGSYSNKSTEKETETSYASSSSSSLKVGWSEGSKTATKSDDVSFSITGSYSGSSSENYNTGAASSSSKDSLSITYADGSGYKFSYKTSSAHSEKTTTSGDTTETDSQTLSITCSTPDRDALAVSGKFANGTYTISSLTVTLDGATEKISNTVVDDYVVPFIYWEEGFDYLGEEGSIQDEIITLIGLYQDMAYTYDSD